jgi:hypothetical protein
MVFGTQQVALLWGLAVLVAVVYLATHDAPTSIVIALMTFLPRRQQLEVGSTNASRQGQDTTTAPGQR